MAAVKTTQHIGILYFNEGEHWAQYLRSQFLKDKRLELEVVLLDLSLENIEADVTSVTSSCYVTILLMTPDILKWLPDIQILNNYLKVVPQHRGIVAMSAFIDDSEYSEIQKACSASSRWTPMTLTETTKEIIKMVAEIIDLVEKTEKAEQTEKAVKQKQAPLPKKRTSVEKHKISAVSETPSIISGHEVRDIFPSKVFTAREKVVIVFKEPVKGTVHVSFKDTNGEKHDTKKLNPYSFRFRTPDPFPHSNMLEIFIDGKQIASKRFTFVKPTQSALQCIGYLMQTIGVENTDELDQRLCDIFERSVPRDNILNRLFSNEEIQCILDATVKPMNEFPTLLHFSAAHGLSDFTSLLLEQPGSMAAFNIVNNNNHSPAEMAAANHHDDLSRYITDFTDTNAIVDACGIYVSMCEMEGNYIDMGGLQRHSGSLEDLYSKTLDDTYLPEDVIPEVEEPPPPLPPIRKTSLPPIPTQHRKLSLDGLNAPVLEKLTRAPHTAPPTPTRPKDVTSPQALGFQNPAAFLEATHPKRKLSAGAVGSSSQQELIDIQILVKNKEFTIDEAVMIYNSWKERPSSQSFKDRKKRLEEIKTRTTEMTTQGNNKSLLKRLISFRKTKRQNVEKPPNVPLGAPYYETYVIPGQFISQTSSLHRASSLSNSSSSSGTSRESGVSLKEVPEIPSSDSEAEEESSQRSGHQVQHRRPNRSNSSHTEENRKSKKDMFLEVSIGEKELELPPVPPRRRRTSQSSADAPPRPPPRTPR